jgi:trans-aconitate methyltransferase
MGYYDDEKTALKYIRMAEGYDGRELIAHLSNHLQQGATVLELGMGPGKDLAMLGKNWEVTGSDHSVFFMELYRADHPDADLLQLEASTLDTKRRWDCIYSNKVLHHLDDSRLQRSMDRQLDLLNEGGLICHSFWKGDETQEHFGMHAQDRTADELRELMRGRFDIVHLDEYAEMEPGDSLLLIARKTA